ncbi:TRAP transporter permease [Geminicoccaceae bacterium 1502E]|nr:TRAP transporter permease [Geminicoccaceae bacterium 1502E]
MSTEQRPAGQVDLQELVAEADTGARAPGGAIGRLLLCIAVAWSLFQLWYASPLPFVFNVFILNDTQARSIHLAFGLFLAFMAYPAFRRSPRDRVPVTDWVMALAGAFCGAYLFLAYAQLATRPGQPTGFDIATGLAGLLLLLEATRRSLGLPMVIVAGTFIAYTFLGPYAPEVIQHKGASLQRFVSHQWLTTEGVFGVALGVSTSFVFLFVLFGSMLDRAGAGNWMMQLSLALLGHLRGGPAKVAVVGSALNGIISGSSVSNVVSSGIFTIPLMRKTGLPPVKAGAVEAASSINGQIMPPVMGAAAFLMVEYVGIPYAQIIKHAALPAIISYLALFYIVHIEALKVGAEPLQRLTVRGPKDRLLRLGLGWSGTILVVVILYYGIQAVKAVFGEAAGPVLAVLGGVLYLGCLWLAAGHAELERDESEGFGATLPDAWPVARTGLYYVIPLVVLLWCLMVEQLSPGLSAFWATVTIMGILVTQRPLLAVMRGGGGLSEAFRASAHDLVGGLEAGARNMIGIAVAVGTAGIVVGTVTLTGLGLMMTDFVEFISAGNVIVMLLLTALVCLVLGMGIPTTANYILVATLMAPVIVELGAQAGLAIPLIAVHMFVFYFGIMADVTPPVGLASFAASAISGADPIRTGLQASFYSLRTAVLPFLFIFNPQILLVDVGNWLEGLLVIASNIAAMLLFSAATMNFWLVRSRIWETALLLVATLLLLSPEVVWNRLYAPTAELPASAIFKVAEELPANGRLVIRVEGLSLEGDEVSKTVSLRIGEAGAARERIQGTGLMLTQLGDEVQVMDARFGTQASRLKLEPGFVITGVIVPAERPSPHWLYLPVLGLVALIGLGQRRRRDRAAATQPAPA